MARDEELREALLEVQLLREREARALRESHALLQVLEALATADSPEAAIDALLHSVRAVTHAAGVAIARKTTDGFSLRRVAPADWTDLMLRPSVDLLRKARNLADLHADPGWMDTVPDVLRDQRALLSVPLPRGDGDAHVLLCFRPGRAAFGPGDFTVLRRIAQLAGQALRALDLSDERDLLAAVIAGSPAGFAIADAQRSDNPLVYVNPAFERISGFDRDEVLGLNCRFLSAEKPDTPERTRLRKTVARQGEGRFLLRNRRKTGELFWNELTVFPVSGGDGSVRYLVGTQTDATDMVLARDERDRAQHRMEQALASTADAFLLIDTDRSVIFANDRVGELFPAPGLDWRPGTGLDENWAAVLRGFPPGQTLSDEMRRADLSVLSDRPGGVELRLPDDRVVLLRGRATQGGGMVISATDVTPLKTAEAMLRQRAVAIESAEDGIAIAEADGSLIYLNSSFAQMMRRRPGGPLLGTDWLSHYMPDDRAQHGPRIARALAETGLAKALLRRQRRDGVIVYHELTLSRVDDVGTVIIARDATDRIVQGRERARLTAELERARQQEAISQLAAGIAHDFNNLLSAINGSAQLIVMDGQTPDAARNHADRIIAAGNRAARMVNRLLDLGAEGEAPQLVDLRAMLAEAVELLSPSLRPGVELVCEPADGALMVTANPTELVQVAVNLMLNAQDSLGDAGAGRIEITAECTTPPPGLRPQVGHLDSETRYARLGVADTGSGIAPDRLPKIFKPYFSTKGAQGTGLGLAMTARIVSEAGGAICVDSAAGRGTRFDIYIPCRSAPADAPDPALPRPDGDSRAGLAGALILIVDDDPGVSEVLGAYLERQGAEVSVTDDPVLALDSLREDPDAWAALITDYDMPGLTGGDLADAARGIRADLPVFLVTALARRLTDPRVSSDKLDGIFAKPVDLRHLAETIGRRLFTAPPEKVQAVDEIELKERRDETPDR